VLKALPGSKKVKVVEVFERVGATGVKLNEFDYLIE